MKETFHYCIYFDLSGAICCERKRKAKYGEELVLVITNNDRLFDCPTIYTDTCPQSDFIYRNLNNA